MFARNAKPRGNPPSSPKWHKPGWRLTFHDEFGGAELDRLKWNTRYVRECAGVAAVVDDALEVSDGMLHIRADRETVTVEQYSLELWAPEQRAMRKGKATYHYTTGALDTRFGAIFAQKYGWFEMCFRTPKRPELVTAWRLYPLDVRYFRTDLHNGMRTDPHEAYAIDIVERIGRCPDDVSRDDYLAPMRFSVHHGEEPSGPKHEDESFVCPQWIGREFSEGFHVLALEWTSTDLVWFIDNREVRRVMGKSPQTQMFMLVNLYVTANNGSCTPVTDETPLPAFLDIDYIRVYEFAG